MTSRLENLQNLRNIGKLKSEPPAQSEFNGLPGSAGNKLRDAENSTLSPESRFSLAYDAAHSLALAALRWHGCRAEDRYIVFQALAHTLCAGNPAADLKEYVSRAKLSPANASYGSAGAGTTLHFIGLVIGQATGVTMTHVAYRGVGPALTDVIGGQVPAVILPLGTLLPQASAGKLRILAHSGGRRSTAAPNIPTFKELGYPAVEISGWFGLFAPARTPAEIVNRYNTIVIQAERTAATQERLRALDLETREASPAELAASLKAEYERWGPIVKASGFSADSQ